jgi:hypothetical protein
MQHPARDRVTVDLRGLGERLRLKAGVQRLSAGAFVRRAILSQLEDDGPGAEPDRPDAIGPVVKVTLRLSAAHAVLQATRTRRADVSQGAYVAGVLDGMLPPPLPPDHAQAIAALVRSTDQLSVLSRDINGFVRALPSCNLERLEPYRRSVSSLLDEVRKHLAVAGALVNDLRRARPAQAKPNRHKGELRTATPPLRGREGPEISR